MKPYIRIHIIVGIIVIAALAVWKGVSHPGTATVSPTPLSAATSVAPLASVSPLVLSYDEPGADWKKYATASADFTVSYPSDWTIGSCGTGCTGWAPATAGQGQFAVGVIESAGTLSDIVSKAQPFLVRQEQVKEGANTWTKLTLQQPTTGDIVTSHFIQHGKNIVEFGTATSDADILKVYGSMIRSFTFTK